MHISNKEVWRVAGWLLPSDTAPPAGAAVLLPRDEKSLRIAQY